MAVLDAARILGVVAANWRPEDHRSVFVVHAEPVWEGPQAIEGDHGLITVVACASPLGVREALVAHEQSGGPLVVLTPCAAAELGADVLARLVRRQVLRVDPFGSVLALFGAEDLDPAVASNPWLIDELIALAPRGGWRWRRPPNRVLDHDLAWQTWQEARLGLDHAPAGLTDVLLAGRRPDLGPALEAMPPEQRAELACLWGGGRTEPASVMVDLMAAGRGPDLVGLGIVAGVLWMSPPDSGMAAAQLLARARLEQFFGRDRLDEASAAAWEAASVEALAHEASPPRVFEAAQALLAREGPGLLALSDRLAGGFEARLNLLGRAISRGDVPGAEAAFQRVSDHRVAGERPERRATAEAALRLLRRGDRPARAPATTLAEAAASYAAEGAWLDEALRAVSEGDEAPDLAAAIGTLASTATTAAQGMRARFGGLLAAWSRAEPMDDPRVVPVEQILDRVVAPVAHVSPVLLLVCDGMPLLVAHSLVRTLFAAGWAPMAPMAPMAPEGQTGWPIGVGVLPTVTEVCRTSLLSGRRARGSQDEERDGFSGHAALAAASSTAKPPVLFHKSSLVTAGGNALPGPVHQAIADPGQRVVGVVVNAVDDHLTRGDQVRVRWDLSTVKPLRWLLDAAEEAGRLVVLTADHGHVLREPGAIRRAGSNPGGERWRVGPPPPGEGEVAISGPRVLLGGGSVILPVDDRISYGVPKHGYHGGATPAEVLVPLDVLGRHTPPGWVNLPITAPQWWDPTGSPEDTPKAPLARSTRRPQPAQDALFEAVSPAPSTSWITRFLACPALVAQRTRARLPRPLPDERLARYLAVIDANGGTILLESMALRIGEPPDALRLALAPVQRLLNMDGAQVLAIGPDATVRLDRQALAQQFEITVP